MDLAALRDMYESGALGRDSPVLLDNDQASVYDYYQADMCVFEMHPADLLRQALTLLGIPWENV